MWLLIFVSLFICLGSAGKLPSEEDYKRLFKESFVLEQDYVWALFLVWPYSPDNRETKVRCHLKWMNWES